MIYLVQFLDDWLDFRYAELFELLKLNKYKPEEVILCNEHWLTQEGLALAYDIQNYVHLSKEQFYMYWEERRKVVSSNVDHFTLLSMSSDEEVQRVFGRAILVKGVYELWSMAASFEENAIRTSAVEGGFAKSQLESERSWSVQVLTFGKTITMEEKQALRNRYSFLDFKGPVNIKEPDREFWIIIDCSKGKGQEGLRACPCYFGRRVLASPMRSALQKYSLKTRLYLGPTSLDDSLAFILSNLAGVKEGDVVWEPFMGTGSVAVALSHFKAFVIGSDIDPRVLRGEMYAGKNQNDGIKKDVLSNFLSYSLQLPELIRMDTHLIQRHFQLKDRMAGLFTAIVTDPPYGIRAGARKSGRRGGQQCDYRVEVDRREDHIPSTQSYPVEEVMLDLLHNAAVCLQRGGVLVYLIPTTYDFSEGDLPQHPCLSVQHICHQPLSARHGRRAVVLVKDKEYSEELLESFQLYKREVLSGEDRGGFGGLMAKLQMALASSAYENEGVVKMISNCGERRRRRKELRKHMRETGQFPHPPKYPNTRPISKKEMKRKEQEKSASIATERCVDSRV